MASIYLHIPFCEKKCIYCDFYSIENLSTIDGFVDLLKREITLYAEYGPKSSFETIFFGGGTPSLLSPETIGDILALLRKTFPVTADAEITMEANPGTVSREKLRGYHNAGVNRMSFGVQSFFEDDLKFLSRIHSVDEAHRAFEDAAAAGFDNLNIDLIFALPGQTPERWQHNLEKAVGLGVPHISAYSLIVEENTPLVRMVRAKQVSPLPTDTEAAMYEQTMAFLGGHGFEHYEVSNYAKPGRASRHNRNYWNHSNYIGFGPSAHSFWDDRRWWNIANLSTYIQKLEAFQKPLAGEEHLTPVQRFDETIMLGLRSDGIELENLKRRFGFDLLSGEHGPIVKGLFDEGLARLDAGKLRLTDKGFLLCEEISERITANISPQAQAIIAGRPHSNA